MLDLLFHKVVVQAHPGGPRISPTSPIGDACTECLPRALLEAASSSSSTHALNFSRTGLPCLAAAHAPAPGQALATLLILVTQLSISDSTARSVDMIFNSGIRQRATAGS